MNQTERDFSKIRLHLKRYKRLRAMGRFWQKLRHWLYLNPRLRPLTVIRRHTFSPQEVQLIYSELGEP